VMNEGVCNGHEVSTLYLILLKIGHVF